MAPSFNDGDWLIIRYGAPFKAGDVVVVKRRLNAQVLDDSLFIKRIKEIATEGITVLGDNPEASTDSRTWGAVPYEQVIAKVLFRYKKARS
ncbi:unannotated protein [freshwater metagenome]|uniref:Unannotated protein n=1 Tax=freshwater metagenome TaxID=449393 RepID=A0A6J7XUA9_9ZZZZ